MNNAQIVAFKGSSACSAINLGLGKEVVEVIMNELNDLLSPATGISNARHQDPAALLASQNVGADQNFGLSGNSLA